MFARTERLLLRPGWMDDAPALARALADVRIARGLATIPHPYALADAQAHLGTADVPRLPRMLIFERTGGAPDLVGGIGLVADGDRATLGYWIRPDRWHHGLATEAGRAMVAIADMLGHAELGATCFLDNPASSAVLRKLGFGRTGNIRSCGSLGRSDRPLCRDMRRSAAAVGMPHPSGYRQDCKKAVPA
ncbi:MAG TPA: GNAT family N-acetyltransferase [Sphingomonas sp.]|jgi:RimJ/RimL family protein N-acetyltransferase|uniref:GNAT family N-acetyltransferase n=1 Tax=Sphingomonas sp. TaxID=28214 RepID=UPI002EDA2973